MPSISSFYGITIYMYFLANEHNPSHVHAYYGDCNATINISNGKVIDGSLPKNALKLVKQWINLHREQLQKIWESQKFEKIAPLDEED